MAKNPGKRVENDAGETKKGQNHPNLPLFEPNYDHSAALARLRAREPENRALREFKPARFPKNPMTPELLGDICRGIPSREAYPGYWAPAGGSHRDQMAAFEHRMRLVAHQERLLRAQGAVDAPE